MINPSMIPLNICPPIKFPQTFPPTLHLANLPPAPRPSPHPSSHMYCSWTGRLQCGGDSCGGVCSAPPVAGWPPLLPKQEQQAVLQQEGPEGSVSRDQGQKGWEGGLIIT